MNPRKEFNVRSLRAEVEELSDKIHHLEAELERARTTLRLKDEYCSTLEEDLQENRERIGNLEQILQE